MAPSPTEDYYSILEVNQNDSVDDIIKSYKRLALLLHPDRNKAKDATAAFQQLGRAYETLSDPTQRKSYDLIHPKIKKASPEPRKPFETTPPKPQAAKPGSTKSRRSRQPSPPRRKSNTTADDEARRDAEALEALIDKREERARLWFKQYETMNDMISNLRQKLQELQRSIICIEKVLALEEKSLYFSTQNNNYTPRSIKELKTKITKKEIESISISSTLSQLKSNLQIQRHQFDKEDRADLYSIDFIECRQRWGSRQDNQKRQDEKETQKERRDQQEKEREARAKAWRERQERERKEKEKIRKASQLEEEREERARVWREKCEKAEREDRERLMKRRAELERQEMEREARAKLWMERVEREEREEREEGEERDKTEQEARQSKIKWEKEQELKAQLQELQADLDKLIAEWQHEQDQSLDILQKPALTEPTPV